MNLLTIISWGELCSLSDGWLVYFGFSTKDMQTPPPPPFRNGHLGTKDVQCAERKGVLKISYHIISRLRVQKGHFGHPKIHYFSKVAKFVGKIGIGLTLIFCANDFFFVILSF